MNIKKTNPNGLLFLDKRLGKFLLNEVHGIFKDAKELKEAEINNLSNEEFIEKYTGKEYLYNNDVFKFNKYDKVLRLSKNVVRNANMINLNSVKNDIYINDFKFNSLVILLENDKEGIIKVERAGSDFSFMRMTNLGGKIKSYINTYSFLTKEFYVDESIEECNLVVKILIYLYYGEITTRHMLPKGNVKLCSFTKFVNGSKFDISFVDSLWKQRISTDGFKVRGHFRMQPYGEESKKRKLIWIEEFSKDGYNRKATRELS